jgi:methylmalonyl-CoA/ethylmalonyl-CoA epimerase
MAHLSKIEHIGIAVRNADASIKLYSALFGVEPYKEEVVESEGVRTVFFQLGPNKVELLEATRPDSPIAKFIEKRGEGLHHVAFAVEDVEEQLNRLKQAGFELITTQPKQGADGKLIAFLHPKSTGGMLTELCADAMGF